MTFAARFVATVGAGPPAPAPGTDPTDFIDLLLWLNAEAGVSASGGALTSWVGQGKGARLERAAGAKMALAADKEITLTDLTVTEWGDRAVAASLTVPGTEGPPDFVASASQGLPGVEFAGTSDHLESSAAVYDNLWSGAPCTVTFAAIIDTLVNGTGNHILLDKGHEKNDGTAKGWAIKVRESTSGSPGCLEFLHKNAAAGGFGLLVVGMPYVAGDIIAGSITWDGVLSTAATYTIRLYDNTAEDWVVFTEADAGGDVTETIPGTFVLGNDSTGNLSIGNAEDAAATPAFFNGKVFGVWFHDPTFTAFQDAFLDRWIEGGTVDESFDVTNGDGGTALVAPLEAGLTLNGVQGIDFSGDTNRGMACSDDVFDRLWSGANTDGEHLIWFALQPTALPAGGNEGVFMAKGRNSHGGWCCAIKGDGSLVFVHLTSGASYFFGFNGVVAVGTPTVGYIKWDGNPTTLGGASGRFWNFTTKVWENKAVFGSPAVGTTLSGDDSAFELYLGRAEAPNSFSNGFSGTIFDIGIAMNVDDQASPTPDGILEAHLAQFTNA